MAETVEYRNPVVKGFNPDPSVVHVDGIYYMATSTFHIFPGHPIYASTNLREWNLISHAINRPEQLSLVHSHSRLVQIDPKHQMVATGGLMAPTIRHHKGRFYVVGSNMVRRNGHLSREQFIVSTTDIWKGSWSNPMTFDFDGFDTRIFVDDDDRIYIQGAWATGFDKQPHTLIYQLELELNTGKILSPARYIWGGHSNHDTEGPHIYKKDGWYYLLAAEGGTFEHHMLTISRSRDIWGPYDTYKNNPILTADGAKSLIQGLGHGELFQDSDGEWWVIALGFRSLDGVWPLGREPFLSKVDWLEGGWPVIDQPKMVFQAPKVRETATLPDIAPVSELVYLRSRNNNHYRISRPDGTGLISMLPSHCTLSTLGGCPTFVGRRQQEFSAVSRVTLDLDGSPASKQHVQAGLTVHLDPLRHASLAFDFAAWKVTFKVQSTGPGATSTELSYAIDRQTTTSLEFKIEATARAYSFSFARVDGSEQAERKWHEAGVATTSELFVRCFTGPIFGVFAQRGGAVVEGREPWVTLRNFETISTRETESC